MQGSEVLRSAAAVACVVVVVACVVVAVVSVVVVVPVGVATASVVVGAGVLLLLVLLLLLLLLLLSLLLLLLLLQNANEELRFWSHGFKIARGCLKVDISLKTFRKIARPPFLLNCFCIWKLKSTSNPVSCRPHV